MTMKKTDLYKNLGKQIERQNKAAHRPDRFGAASADAAVSGRKATATPRSVTVSCRLPADLANQLRAHALNVDGGVSAVVASALTQWLNALPEAEASE